MSLSIAFSPCPNDTFVFHALVHGLVPGAPSFDVTFADVDVTNTSALDGRFDLVKVSYAALPWLLDTYELLPCGGALGRGCGPLLLTNGQGFHDGVVAVPGERTTAYLLMRLWAQQSGQVPREVVVVPFHEIMPGVAAGRFDAGLVIHEARFTYQRYGLTQLVDLGEWWETDTGLPIPLGAILAKRGAVDPVEAAEWIRQSVRTAWADPSLSRDYVLSHAQEMEPEVVDAHIALYVNEFTENLGPDGERAVAALLKATTA
ncbi:1,4-dihydroxy-6-naphthoate synthase [Allocatelliglobosispora scoriae]|uniref:1,4-dihydroxy-6-naphtoate synthase n=1 Tax=Allocatelliglobosispora scoriae TaxID=643052 RepID=A0A841BV58_9ACTN|nr:1,4-dihydroxy-6-naphthoate synthase [Allocatelliglobosispora scoriae]MBB5871338.1 1,4-dihydroxy-6-naphthoate synthase [Allocatelliglobosispora scoriae]